MRWGHGVARELNRRSSLTSPTHQTYTFTGPLNRRRSELVKTPIRKPIGLKALAAQRTPELAAMEAELDGRSAKRSKATRAIWTREFLASGKPATTPG